MDHQFNNRKIIFNNFDKNSIMMYNTSERK